ncbi:GNAT family N-acetyltransferase [Notoacmeibacter sp. MSK16QG-6]|uniref:GNAT family N-acetyltransferase n=1 Tax=Notoacmeibacter sp. MSK16QG-6 TaxID=2957982 RepID=UPI0020A059AA|nr:GNAT family N-acetyltransferase [Notoacmeibacter sp. MSK16QG-6]MCP1199153.1 GNAT family N-acetyltransferase [Notoacmeibacter sp. MSK16QG-6]
MYPPLSHLVHKVLRHPKAERRPSRPAWKTTDVRRIAETKCGMKIMVRYGGPEDAAALSDFHRRQRPEDLQFRFLTAMSTVSPERIAEMLNGDHEHKAIVLAFEEHGRTVLGYALVAGDNRFDTAEIALSVDPSFRRRGIASLLVYEAERFAESRGYGASLLIGSRQNRAVIELERSLGYSVRTMPDDATLSMAERSLAG